MEAPEVATTRRGSWRSSHRGRGEGDVAPHSGVRASVPGSWHHPSWRGAARCSSPRPGGRSSAIREHRRSKAGPDQWAAQGSRVGGTRDDAGSIAPRSRTQPKPALAAPIRPV
jgi:hypothetical protein